MNDGPGEHHGNLVKICGLRELQHAVVAADAGAGFLGFILAESRRQVDLDLVRQVRSTLDQRAGGRPRIVGVSVNSTAGELERAVAEGGLDIVQLSGDETPKLLKDIDVPVIKTLHVAPGMDVDVMRREADAWLNGSRSVMALHIDAKVPGHYGGTGVRADWDIAAKLASDYPVLLAGGLDPENVGQGIDAVRPVGVDVASGVERDGEKDPELIEWFIANARAAFAGV